MKVIFINHTGSSSSYRIFLDKKTRKREIKLSNVYLLCKCS